MSQFHPLDRTALLAADDLGGQPLTDFLKRARRLPTFSRNHAFHEGDARLAPALRPLQGKFSVINPTAVVPVPARLAPALRTLLRRLRGAAARFAVVLEEPARPEVHHELLGGEGAAPGQQARFHGELPYRLTVELEPGRANLASRLHDLLGAPAADAPVIAPWFHFPLLVPDAEARRQMVPLTRQFYLDVTGRLGAGSRDRYWYVEAWERFHGSGRMIGCIVPSLLAHGHIGGARRAATPLPTDAERAPGEAAPISPLLTPDFDRRGFVPPGYCLVHYVATIELAVAVAQERSAAA